MLYSRGSFTQVMDYLKEPKEPVKNKGEHTQEQKLRTKATRTNK
jgi:hypothetical protein